MYPRYLSYPIPKLLGISGSRSRYMNSSPVCPVDRGGKGGEERCTNQAGTLLILFCPPWVLPNIDDVKGKGTYITWEFIEMRMGFDHADIKILHGVLFVC